jgi:hypothetical protein
VREGRGEVEATPVLGHAAPRCEGEEGRGEGEGGLTSTGADELRESRLEGGE